MKLQPPPRAAFCLAALLLPITLLQAAPEPPKYPLKVSENGRHLVDAAGRPFFLLGEGAWFPPFRLTREEIAEYFEARQRQGFNAFIIDVLDETANPRAKNKYGHVAFDPPDDFSKPNEAYFKYLDEIVAMAKERGLVLLLTVTYLGPGDEGNWVRWVAKNGPEKCAGFARWLANRYKESPNIIWVLNGDRDAKMGRFDVTREMDAQGRAIREANPAALITVHDSPHTDHYEFRDASWHDLVWMYSYRIPTSPLAHMYYTNAPTRPVYLAEVGYDGLDQWNARTIRAQTYGAWLAGATAGAFYGSQMHYFKQGWREWLNKDSARQFMHFGQLARSLDWWKLKPDIARRLVIAGNAKPGTREHIVAAIATDKSFALAYLPPDRTPAARFTVDLGVLKAPVKARWLDPTSGAFRDIEGSPFKNVPREYTPPSKNAAGENDWVLVSVAR